MLILKTYNGGQSWQSLPGENNEKGLKVYLLNMQDRAFRLATFKQKSQNKQRELLLIYKSIEITVNKWLSMIGDNFIIDLDKFRETLIIDLAKSSELDSILPELNWLHGRMTINPELTALQNYIHPEDWYYDTGIYFKLESAGESMKYNYDAFIVHASEDKEDFVTPLANGLKELNFKIWYDQFVLHVGDSLRQAVDIGLSQSRFGIVVLSNAFFKKHWTQYELNGLVSKEENGVKVILPIWYGVSRDQVKSYSPSLSDKKALDASVMNMDEILEELSLVIASRVR